MGLSQAGKIVVVDDGVQKVPNPLDSSEVMEFLKKLDIEPCETILPKSCPNGCPNGGVCQVATGRCACYQSFMFVDGDCPLNDGKEHDTNFFAQLPLGEDTAAPTERIVVLVVGIFLLAVAACLFRVQKTRVDWFQSSASDVSWQYGLLGSVHEQELGRIY